LPVETLEQLVASDPRSSVEVVYPDELATASLPISAHDRLDLPTDNSRHGWSFADVPQRTHRAVSIVRAPDCRVLVAKGEWDLDYIAVLSQDDHRLQYISRWVSGHRELLAERAEAEHRPQAAWVLGAFHLNYFHWLIETIPKLDILRRHQLEHLIVLPPDFDPPAVWYDSAAAVGVDLSSLDRMSEPMLAADELILVDLPLEHPQALREVREAVIGELQPDPHRRLFVSRRGAPSRRLVNEEEVEASLVSFGFEVVQFEQLTFAEQVSLCVEASIVVGVHGAGLANFLFAPRDSCLIEIVDPTAAHPEFYNLASVLGHRYGFLLASPTGQVGPGGQDLAVDIGALERLIADAL
jgi:capsular polysaccharide biosynthesis protein